MSGLRAYAHQMGDNWESKGADPRAARDLFGALSPVEKRLIEASTAIRQDAPEEVTFQHTVLCQTALPVRRPESSVRVWEREQGRAALRIEAGAARDPRSRKFVELPLPFGPKARLVLMHLNSEAIRRRSPEIEVEDSMTAFVRRLMRADPNGREIRAFKDQLAALSAATVRLAVDQGERMGQVNTQIVGAFDLWFPKDARQRVLWPSTVRLSADYFESLSRFAVPLDERAIAALAHSAQALDVYAWLAQRLHRVPKEAPQFIPWPALQEQFGQGFTRIRDFRRKFLMTLRQVQTAYPEARFTADEQGMMLCHSRSPVAKRMHVLAQNGA
ncbi:replication protein RepA [Roseomonas mucosa]